MQKLLDGMPRLQDHMNQDSTSRTTPKAGKEVKPYTKGTLIKKSKDEIPPGAYTIDSKGNKVPFKATPYKKAPVASPRVRR